MIFHLSRNPAIRIKKNRTILVSVTDAAHSPILYSQYCGTSEARRRARCPVIFVREETSPDCAVFHTCA
jgi:hypothetical protein